MASHDVFTWPWEEVIHGMWELAVKKEHLADFPPEAFEQIVMGGWSKSHSVCWMACAAGGRYTGPFQMEPLS